MASDPKTVAYIVDQAGGAGTVSARAMFGEHGLYLDGKLVALVCDDQLFVKPTSGGRAHAPDLADAPPYPGAKPCLLVEPDRWDDRDWLVELFRRTAAELLPPRQRAPRPRPKAR